MPVLSVALQSGWFDATFPNCASGEPHFEHDVLAKLVTFRTAAGKWSQGFDILCSGLSSGYPDACAYHTAATVYVEHAMSKHRQLVDSKTDSTLCAAWAENLKPIFILQAWILRYDLMIQQVVLTLAIDNAKDSSACT